MGLSRNSKNQNGKNICLFFSRTLRGGDSVSGEGSAGLSRGGVESEVGGTAVDEVGLRTSEVATPSPNT